MTRREYELLQNTLKHNRPQGDNAYGPCPRQVEGYEKACRAIAHALTDNDPKFDARGFLQKSGVSVR